MVNLGKAWQIRNEKTGFLWGPKTQTTESLWPDNFVSITEYHWLHATSAEHKITPHVNIYFKFSETSYVKCDIAENAYTKGLPQAAYHVYHYHTSCSLYLVCCTFLRSDSIKNYMLTDKSWSCTQTNVIHTHSKVQYKYYNSFMILLSAN